jgi:hypothetical protein
MHFLDDFHLLVAAGQIGLLNQFFDIQSQHADIVLLTPLVRARLYLDCESLPNFFWTNCRSATSSLGRAPEIRKPPAGAPSLIVTPELALSVGNPWAFAETPF